MKGMKAMKTKAMKSMKGMKTMKAVKKQRVNMVGVVEQETAREAVGKKSEMYRYAERRTGKEQWEARKRRMEEKKTEGKKVMKKAKRQGTETKRMVVVTERMAEREREGDDGEGGGRGCGLEEWRKSVAEKLKENEELKQRLARAVDFEEERTDWRAVGREMGKRWKAERQVEGSGGAVDNLRAWLDGIKESIVEEGGGGGGGGGGVKREKKTEKRRRMRRKQKAGEED